MAELRNPHLEGTNEWLAWETVHRDKPMDIVSDYPPEFKLKSNAQFGKKPASSITIHGLEPQSEVFDLYVICQHIEEIYKDYLRIKDFIEEMITYGREDLMHIGRMFQAGEEYFNGMASPETEKRSKF